MNHVTKKTIAALDSRADVQALVNANSVREAINKYVPYVTLASSSQLPPLNRKNFDAMMNHVRLSDLVKGHITESDLAVAATGVVPGVYSARYGRPDDWTMYWDYLAAYLYIPEVTLAVKMKTRMMWKMGYEFTGTDDKKELERVEAEWKRLKLKFYLRLLSKNGFIFGNGYAEKVSNSVAVFNPDETLKSYQPATAFYGLKVLDPRTMTCRVDRNTFDTKRCEPTVLRYGQVKLAPDENLMLPNKLSVQSNEINMHVEDIFHLKFDCLISGVFGSSVMREALYTIKAYIIMLQYLPTIVEKRAYPTLHIQQGKDVVYAEDGRTRTYLPNDDDFEYNKASLQARGPSEDYYTDILTTIKEVYTSRSNDLQGVQNFIMLWKERVMIGLGIPTSVMDSLKNGGEIKWGDLKFGMLCDDVVEKQEDLEDVVNSDIMPLISKTVQVHFKPPTAEDMEALVTAMVALFEAKLISAEWARKRLDIPEEAGKGTMFDPANKQPDVYVKRGEPPKDKPAS